MLDLNSYKKSISKTRKPLKKEVLRPINKKIKLVKNNVLNFYSDTNGCGHIRSLFPMNYINSVFAAANALTVISSLEFLYQDNLLIKSRSLYFQRHMGTAQKSIIRSYKAKQDSYRYKMVWDIDDMIWGYNELQGGSKEHGVPSYNQTWSRVTNELKTNSIEIMKMMDLISVSTQFLKDYLINELKIKVPIVVMQNSVAKYLWGSKEKTPIIKNIKKPKVIYTGSPTHYSNKDKLYGDWDNNWKDWVIENVNNDKIDFVIMGALPWFFKEIEDKIECIPWLNSYSYSNAVKDINADFGIIPLVQNDFNRAKSNLKMLEYSAAGIISIGSSFTDGTKSPYEDTPVTLPWDVSKKEISNMIKNLSKKENYNRTLKEQYNYLEENNHWLESKGYVDKFVQVINGIVPKE